MSYVCNKIYQNDPLIALIISWGFLVFLLISTSIISFLSPSAKRMTHFAFCKRINLKISVESFTYTPQMEAI